MHGAGGAGGASGAGGAGALLQKVRRLLQRSTLMHGGLLLRVRILQTGFVCIVWYEKVPFLCLPGPWKGSPPFLAPKPEFADQISLYII